MKTVNSPTLTGAPRIKLSGYSEPAILFEGLRRVEPSAIKFLHQKVAGFLQKRGAGYSASTSDLEEMANDAILITLKKIAEGEFQFQGLSPIAYAKGVGQNLLRNFSRKKDFIVESVSTLDLHHEAKVLTYLIKRECETEVVKALDTLDADSRQVIWLKYYEELTDAEVIDKKLTTYTSVHSLRNKRCKCLKKLSEMTALKRLSMS